MELKDYLQLFHIALTLVFVPLIKHVIGIEKRISRIESFFEFLFVKEK